MEFKLYKCRHCGNIVYKIVDKGVPVVCCGEKMEEMIPNTTDGALEKHVPSIQANDGIAAITVGEVIHPMEEQHYIQFIAAQSGNTVKIKYLKPGEEPVMHFATTEKITAYELCNLHGYWKGE